MAEALYFCPGCLMNLEGTPRHCQQCGFSRPEAGWPADPYIGRTINNKYRMESRLGAGGFAQVFLAEQVQDGIELGDVVLKFLHKNLATNQSIRRRFINEARAARKVRSPHVVKVFDLGFDDDGTPYMAMEYLEGEGLEKVLDRETKLSPKRTFDLGLQVAGALDECHKIGIIHRDLKPDNLLLLPGRGEDFVKVLDFGIARVPTEDGTLTHTLMGTPRYMPPEQIMQREMDGGVDIFALGVILYECLAGTSPIPAKTPMEYLQLNLNTRPTPLRQERPDLPEDLERLLNRMMAKDRADRPPSMADVEQRLKKIGVAHGWLAGDSRGEWRPPVDAGATEDLTEIDNGDDEDLEAVIPTYRPNAEPTPPTLIEAAQHDEVDDPGPEILQQQEITGSFTRSRVMIAALVLLGLAGLGVGIALTRDRGEGESDTADMKRVRIEDLEKLPGKVATPKVVHADSAILARPDAGMKAEDTLAIQKPAPASKTEPPAVRPKKKPSRTRVKKPAQSRRPVRPSPAPAVDDEDEYGDRAGGL